MLVTVGGVVGCFRRQHSRRLREGRDHSHKGPSGREGARRGLYSWKGVSSYDLTILCIWFDYVVQGCHGGGVWVWAVTDSAHIQLNHEMNSTTCDHYISECEGMFVAEDVW